jgi:hypothetical protein
VRGGTSLTGSVDVIVEVERPPASMNAPEGARVLKIISRYAGAPDEIMVVLEGDSWKAAGPVKVAAQRWRAERVLELLTPEPSTREEILARSGGELSEPTLRRRLDALVAQGQVELSGSGVKGDPWRWRLSQTPTDFPVNPKNALDRNPVDPHQQAAENMSVTSGGSPGAVDRNPPGDATSGSMSVTEGPAPRLTDMNPETLECELHDGQHQVIKTAAGIVYLACGCHLERPAE